MRIGVGGFKLGQNEKKALMEVVDSGKLSEGKKTFEFEKSWAEYIGTKYAVAVNSGTSALIAGLLALKTKYALKDGSKVITTPLTFIATINAIVHSGLEPVFVDVDKDNFVITPENIKSAIKKEKRVSIILPVHLMGYSADMDEINKLARDNQLLVMEDAAQAHGTIYNGKKLGTFSELGVFSFYIAHNIQAGEMGAVNTNDDEIYKFIKRIKAHGRMCECNVCTRSKGVCPYFGKNDENEDFDPRFRHNFIGFNFKIMEFQTALGLTQLMKADDIFARRSHNVKYLNEGLNDLSNILQLPAYSDKVSYLAYPIVIKNNKVISRNKLCRDLEKNEIETRPLFGCIPLQQPAYGYLKARYLGNLPVAEYIGHNGLYIGCHQYLTDSDLDYVINTFKRIFK